METNGEGRTTITVDFGWRLLGRVERDMHGRLVFPDPGKVPGVYRFRLVGASTELHYVGEGDDLKRRWQRYRTPDKKSPDKTKQTNRRLSDVLQAHLDAGGEVEVEIVPEDVVVSWQGKSMAVDVGDKVTRLLVESAGRFDGNAAGREMLNR